MHDIVSSNSNFSPVNIDEADLNNITTTAVKNLYYMLTLKISCKCFRPVKETYTRQKNMHKLGNQQCRVIKM